MAFDYKKEYREFYLPKNQPELVEVPPMQYVAVSGIGDPNEEGGAYQQAVGILYAVSYTIKMSKKGDHTIAGYVDYVVPPLEGFWWLPGTAGVDVRRKAEFHWTSVIRLPDFVTEPDFVWAVQEVTRKKKLDCACAELLPVREGLCVQCMHVGTYDSEPATVERMHAFAQEAGYVPEFTDQRRHHEIYLSDPRRTQPEKLRTVIRHPVKKRSTDENLGNL